MSCLRRQTAWNARRRGPCAEGQHLMPSSRFGSLPHRTQRQPPPFVCRGLAELDCRFCPEDLAHESSGRTKSEFWHEVFYALLRSRVSSCGMIALSCHLLQRQLQLTSKSKTLSSAARDGKKDELRSSPLASTAHQRLCLLRNLIQHVSNTHPHLPSTVASTQVLGATILTHRSHCHGATFTRRGLIVTKTVSAVVLHRKRYQRRLCTKCVTPGPSLPSATMKEVVDKGSPSFACF